MRCPPNSKLLRDLRDEKRLTQDEMAQWLGVSQSAYSEYERGDVKKMSVDVASRIDERTEGRIPMRGWLRGKRAAAAA